MKIALAAGMLISELLASDFLKTWFESFNLVA